MASGVVVIGVASAEIAGPDVRRGSILVQNLSANDVWLSFGSTAVAGQCLHLPPNQAAPIFLDANLFFEDLQGSIFGIASAAGSKVWYVLQPIP